MINSSGKIISSYHLIRVKRCVTNPVTITLRSHEGVFFEVRCATATCFSCRLPSTYLQSITSTSMWFFFFSVTHKGSLHMELYSVSFPPQRSHHNELPVPPLLVMSPAAQSRHKHVTIMLSTLLRPTAHLAMGVTERSRHQSTWERELCIWCVRVYVHVHVCVLSGVEGVIRGHQASLPLLPKEGLLCDRSLVSCFGTNENVLLHHVFWVVFYFLFHILQPLIQSVCMPNKRHKQCYVYKIRFVFILRQCRSVVSLYVMFYGNMSDEKNLLIRLCFPKIKWKNWFWCLLFNCSMLQIFIFKIYGSYFKFYLLLSKKTTT